MDRGGRVLRIVQVGPRADFPLVGSAHALDFLRDVFPVDVIARVAAKRVGLLLRPSGNVSTVTAAYAVASCRAGCYALVGSADAISRSHSARAAAGIASVSAPSVRSDGVRPVSMLPGSTLKAVRKTNSVLSLMSPPQPGGARRHGNIAVVAGIAATKQSCAGNCCGLTGGR